MFFSLESKRVFFSIFTSRQYARPLAEWHYSESQFPLILRCQFRAESLILCYRPERQVTNDSLIIYAGDSFTTVTRWYGGGGVRVRVGKVTPYARKFAM